MIKKIKNLKISIIGLGYAGLPLAVEFGKKRKVIGFDIQKKRIKDLESGIDKNQEITKKELKVSKKLTFTSNKKDLKSTNCYIIAVPTPLNDFKKPNLKELFIATEIIAKIIKRDDLIIYESTVYPGCIEDKCVPILEKFSKLKFNHDFFCGYSPERINPGDKKHKITSIKKITSGSTPEVADLVDKLYNEIITAGTHKVSSIKVAESAKIIENIQRDINIALFNEFSILFNKMSINTKEVIDAAATKWNFMAFKPGLVGGHCIGVDPYYLTYKAKKIGHTSKIILGGRNFNENFHKHIVSQLIKKMKKKKIKIKSAKILIMGIAYKKNINDIRNSGVIRLLSELNKYELNVDLHDPLVDQKNVKKMYNITPKLKLNKNTYDAIILAVNHDEFKKKGINNILNLCRKKKVIYDLNHLFLSDQVDLRL